MKASGIEYALVNDTHARLLESSLYIIRHFRARTFAHRLRILLNRLSFTFTLSLFPRAHAAATWPRHREKCERRYSSGFCFPRSSFFVFSSERETLAILTLLGRTDWKIFCYRERVLSGDIQNLNFKGPLIFVIISGTVLPTVH